MLLWVPGVLSRPPGGPPHIPVRWVDAIAAVWASISEGSLWPLRWVSPAAAHSAPLCGGSEGHVVLSARPSRSVVHFVVHQVGGWVGRRKKTPAPPLVEIRRLSIIGLILRVFVLILHRYLHFTPYHTFCQISNRPPKVTTKKYHRLLVHFQPSLGRKYSSNHDSGGWLLLPIFFSP